MRKSIVDLSNNLFEEVKEMIQNNPYGYSEGINEIASSIESNRGYRLSDFNSLNSHFLEEELNLYKKQESDNKIDILALETSRKVLDRAKLIRRKKNTEANKVDTNILSHNPFLAGGSRKRKDLAKKENYIELDKNGLKRMTYKNNEGSLLTSKDARTLIALFALWEEQKFGDWLVFTEYKLLEKLGIGIGGKQYKLIRHSLEKLRTTSVVFQEAFIQSEGKRTITESFPLIIANKFILDEDNDGRLVSKQYEIQFSPYIHKSIQDGYNTLVSLAVLNELQLDISQSIYLLISGLLTMEDNELYKRDDGSYEVPLDSLYNTLLLEDSNRKNKATIDKGCNELMTTDILKEYHFNLTGRRYTSLVIYPSDWLLTILTAKDTPINLESKFDQLPNDPKKAPGFIRGECQI